MKTVKIGIIGLGNMGTSHAKNIFSGKVPGMELGAICDIAEARREFAKKNFEGVGIFSSAEEMYASKTVDASINRRSAL